jgi:hypothetical protein
VEDVDLSAFLDNCPGNANATAAVEEDEEDDRKVDGGDVSDDEAEDGLEGCANSADSGGPVMTVPPCRCSRDQRLSSWRGCRSH